MNQDVTRVLLTKDILIMKRFLLAASIVTAALCTPAFAGDVGVSVSIGQPGFYGRLDVGGFPAPALIYPQPIMVRPVHVERPPLYLRVPPGHNKHWNKHCREYNACNERVYFVQNNWYNREYVPRHQERYGERRDHERGGGWGHYRGDDRRDEHRDHDRGHDRGNGHRHGGGHDH
jgi:hypothetical protein